MLFLDANGIIKQSRYYFSSCIKTMRLYIKMIGVSLNDIEAVMTMTLTTAK